MAHVLIIDDDKIVREATQILLRARGYEVTVAAGGKAGLEAVRSGAIDLAIVDLFMPDMDGLEVVQTIRQMHPAMPIIVASGFMFEGKNCPPMPGFEAMASEAGALRTLYKPLRPNDVVQAVQDALGASSASVTSIANKRA